MPLCTPRRTSCVFAALLVLVAGCRTLQVDPAPPSPDDWLTEGRTVARGSTAETLPLPLEVLWEYDASAGFGSGSPLLFGETLVVASRNGEVHAIDLESGRRLGMKSFGDAIEGTPVFAGGMLYVPVAWGRRALAAYDLSRATTRWTHRHPPIEAGLLLNDGQLLGVDVEGNVRAYDPAGGDTLWHFALGRGRTVHGAPLAAAGRTLLADDAGRVTALDEAGRSVWTLELGTPVMATGAAQGDMTYFPTTRGRVFAVDAAIGRVAWRYEVPDTTVYLAAPAVDARLLVAGGSDGVVRALDPATGALQWQHDLDESIVAAPLLTPEHVFVGTTGQEVVALDRGQGEVVWRAEVDGRVRSALVARGNRLIVLTDDRHVYLFAPAVPDYASKN